MSSRNSSREQLNAENEAALIINIIDLFTDILKMIKAGKTLVE